MRSVSFCLMIQETVVEMRPPKPPTWTRISTIYLHNQPAAFIWSLYFFSHITLKKLFIIFGCTRSSLLCMGFLYLPRTGATLCCCVQASHCSGISCCGTQALGMWASVAVVHRLSWCGSLALTAGSVVVVHGLSCSMIHGIFLDQGSNPCPLHWQVDSYPQGHQGSLQNFQLGAAHLLELRTRMKRERSFLFPFKKIF